MESDTGGWTIIQRRIDGTTHFSKKWDEYKMGFGDASHEYWLGNEYLHQMTSNSRYELRVDLWNREGVHKYATYSTFNLSDESSGYKLFLDGFHRDNGLENNFDYHIGVPFSTYDWDQDTFSNQNCARNCQGGWWYKSCFNVNLNGRYGGTNDFGIHWLSFGGYAVSLKRTEMKIRKYTQR